MAPPIREPLTDEELLAVAESKDPQLTAKLNSEERRRLTRLSSMAPAGSGTLRATPGITSEMPSRLEQVNTMLAPMAHPQTVGDFASLLLPDAAAGISAATKAVRTGVGAGAELAGRGMEALGKSRLGHAAEYAGGTEAIWRQDPKGLAVAVAPTALKVGGRAMQRIGQAIRPAVPSVERVAAETPLELTRRLKAEWQAAHPVEPPTPPATAPPSAPTLGTLPPPVPSSASPFQRMQQEGAFQGERVYTGPEGPGSLGNTLKQVERRVATKGLPPGMSERRMAELQQKFGGTQGTIPPSPPTPSNPVAANRGTRRAAAASSPAFDLNSLTPEERIQGETWLRQGIPADVILQRIKLSRQFTGTLNTATPEEAAREVERMVRKAAARKPR